MDFQFKHKYDISDLLSIMALLRSPNGCPWDIKQTHESIRASLIEETYEVLEAIDKKDCALLQEELGDLLLQIVFHSIIEQEKGSFSFGDVCDGICQKLIIRHPHVFGDVSAETPEEVLKNWDAIKRETKGQSTAFESMLNIPKGLPALIRAQKIQKKAANVGFDWDDVSGALDKIDEESAELREAVLSGAHDEIEDELGDLLFSAVNVSRFVKADPEFSLNRACDKFTGRFKRCELLAKGRGLDIETMSLEELDRLWDEVKAAE